MANEKIYTLDDFLEYPNRCLNLALLPNFTSNKDTPEVKQSFLKRVLLFLYVMNNTYPHLGMGIYFLSPTVRSYAYDYAIPVIGQIFEIFAVSFYLLVGSSKLYLVLMHRDRISSLIHEFNEIFPSAKLQTKQHTEQQWLYRIEHFATTSRLTIRRNVFWYMVSLFSFNMLPNMNILYQFVTGEEVVYRAQTHTWYPWDTPTVYATPFGFLVSYTLQLICSLAGMAFIMSGEFLFCFFVTQLELHLDFLTHALQSLDAKKPESQEQLRFLIVYHKRLLRLTARTNEIFNMCFLVNLSLTTLSISMMALATVMVSISDGIKFCAGVVFFLLMSFLFCSNGDKFTQASIEVRPAAFYSNWYEGSLSYQRMILFFITCTTETNEFKAYGYTAISMETYMSILKFSYQLFTFFRTMDF